MPITDEERELRGQIENTVRRIKRLLLGFSRRGALTTNDFVQRILVSIFTKERYAHELSLGRDKRSFVQVVTWAIKDELKKLKRDIDVEVADLLPAENVIEEAIHDFQSSHWLRVEVDRLRAGDADPAAKSLLVDICETGDVLSLMMAGKTTAEMAKILGLSAGSVSARRADGISYLTKLLQMKEAG